ncbi:MAG: LCP family protein [Firmicutes bacterium]|nr:LCP family protein [Bacillota bacterium]
MSRAEKKRRKSPVDWYKGLATWKKIAFPAAIVIILAIVIIAAMLAGYAEEQHGIMYEETPEDYDLSLTAVDGYINILLLGVDSRDMNNINGTRSDAIMVVSINEETNDVKIISTYRDTYLKMGDTSTFDKITHACVYGGPEMTMKSLNQAMDLNIQNYVVVNFKAVADLVDAVGGITVDVQDYEIQQLNKYTIQTAKNIGRENYQTVTAAGTQTLDGCQAVSYSRIRKGVGDDFKRTERMRTVLTKVFNKMKTMSFSEIKGLIELMTPQVKTNLDMNNILALASRLPSFNIQGSVGWPYNVTTGFIGRASVVLPVDLVANAVKLHQEMFLQEDYVPSALLTSISNELAARIQAARDAQEIENEKDVEIDEKEDPTQVPDDTEVTDPTINPETGLPWDPTDPNSPNYDPELNNPDSNPPGNPDNPEGGEEMNPTNPSNPGDSDHHGGETDPLVPSDPNNPGGETTPPQNPATPGTSGENTSASTVPAGSDQQSGSGEIQDDPDEQVVSEQGT